MTSASSSCFSKLPCPICGSVFKVVACRCCPSFTLRNNKRRNSQLQFHPGEWISFHSANWKTHTHTHEHTHTHSAPVNTQTSPFTLAVLRDLKSTHTQYAEGRWPVDSERQISSASACAASVYKQWLHIDGTLQTAGARETGRRPAGRQVHWQTDSQTLSITQSAVVRLQGARCPEFKCVWSAVFAQPSSVFKP